MRTEKKLLNKEALRTIKGGWGFTFPSSVTAFPTSDDSSSSDGITPSDASGEDNVIDVGAPTAAQPPIGVGKRFF